MSWYFAPEYAQSGQITDRAYVNSIGVELVDLITGRKAVDLTRPKGQQCFADSYTLGGSADKSGVFTVGDKVLATRFAIHVGVAGIIIVSKHGARKLDYVPATIMALEVCESRDKKHQLNVLK